MTDRGAVSDPTNVAVVIFNQLQERAETDVMLWGSVYFGSQKRCHDYADDTISKVNSMQRVPKFCKLCSLGPNSQWFVRKYEK